MEENAEGGLLPGKCYISQSACYDDARAVADLVEERFPNLNGKSRDQQHRNHHRQPHCRAGNRGIVFSGGKNGDLTSCTSIYSKTRK